VFYRASGRLIQAVVWPGRASPENAISTTFAVEGLSCYPLPGRWSRGPNWPACSGYGCNSVIARRARSGVHHRLQPVFPCHAARLEPPDAGPPGSDAATAAGLARRRVVATVVRGAHGCVRRLQADTPARATISAIRHCGGPDQATGLPCDDFLVGLSRRTRRAGLAIYARDRARAGGLSAMQRFRSLV
jgi:hypothetical protein